jgi:hypothetical protein
MLNINSSRSIKHTFIVALALFLSACGGGGSNTTTTPTTPVTVTPTAAAINLSATLTSVASDNSTSTVITATVVDAANAAVSGVTITFSADSGFLSLGTAVSDSTGKAQVTFSSGSSNPTTRTATITATASAKTSQIPIRISGASLTVTASATTLVVGGSASTLTATLKNASGAALPNQTVTISASGSGSVTLAPTTGATDANGLFVATATGLTAGTVTVAITAAGETRTVALTVSGPSLAFQITAPSADPTANAATIGSGVTVTVQAPAPTTSVTFVSTLGTWDATGSGVITKAVTGGTVSAILVSNLSGVANIQVFDSARQATLTSSRVVSYTAASVNAFKVTLQSTPSVVAPSLGGNSSLSSLIASVTDASGNPVGGASVAFSILNPTGGGETINPAVILTSSVASSTTTLGQASTTFTAGSLPSGAAGVKVRARIVGTSIATNSLPSGNDATIVIGGTAGSVTIGLSTVIADAGSSTIYQLPMSVLVADSNGNPVANTVVSLSTWPIAFNVGGDVCAPLVTPPGATTPVSTQPGTFYFNEDLNENVVRDPSEVTAARSFYPALADGTRVTSSSFPVAGQLTPPNSAAGTLPATVTTDASGVATFTLTYTKSNSAYIVDRIRARTLVQGTETLGELQFQLRVLVSDLGTPGTSSCHLNPSPYN